MATTIDKSKWISQKIETWNTWNYWELEEKL